MYRMFLFLVAVLSLFHFQAQAFDPGGFLKAEEKATALDEGAKQQIENIIDLIATANGNLEGLLNDSPNTWAVEQAMLQLKNHVGKYVSLLKSSFPDAHRKQVETFFDKFEENYSALKRSLNDEDMALKECKLL